jgi:hypothetical protein
MPSIAVRGVEANANPDIIDVDLLQYEVSGN